MDQEVAVESVVTEVPLSAPAEVSAPVETAPTTAQPAEGDTAPTPPAKTFTQSDLDRILARERAKESRRAERFGYERAMREAAEKQLAEIRTPPTSSPQTGDEPQQSQFHDYDSYVKAYARWTVQQELRTVSKQAEEQRSRSEAEKSAAEVMAKLAPGAKKYEDFHDVVFADDLRITKDMAETILDLGSDGNDVAYFLGTHPQEAERIAGLSKVGQVREIDKLATTLKAPPKVTTAPPPITPNTGTGTVEKRLEDASMAEFVKIRQRQIAAKRA